MLRTRDQRAAGEPVPHAQPATPPAVEADSFRDRRVRPAARAALDGDSRVADGDERPADRRRIWVLPFRW